MEPAQLVEPYNPHRAVQSPWMDARTNSRRLPHTTWPNFSFALLNVDLKQFSVYQLNILDFHATAICWISFVAGNVQTGPVMILVAYLKQTWNLQR